MISTKSRINPFPTLTQTVSVFISVVLIAAPLCAQQATVTPTKSSGPRPTTSRPPEPTFDTLLAADSYVVYGEVRNLGQLLSTGGAGDIIDPIAKLSDPGKEFKSIIKFLKANAEALATSRLLFAASPTRADVPTVFAAIEFSTTEEAAKFAPKLENFLPQILPPPPPSPTSKPAPSLSGPANETTNETKPENFAGQKPTPSPTRSPAPDPVPFVITHSGNLVFISDRPFKFEKLRPASSKLLAEDQNFRVARDRLSSESVFLYFNLHLEENSKPTPTPIPVISEEEMTQRIKRQQEESGSEFQITEMTVGQPAPPGPTPLPPEANVQLRGSASSDTQSVAVLGVIEPSPTPTPTQTQQAQRAAYTQMGRFLDFLGMGQPQWPEAIGVALTLDNNEYVIRALLVESHSAKRLPLPFLPQLVSGLAHSPDAPTVLPDDTEVFVSMSIDFSQTYEGIRQQAEISRKTVARKSVGEKDESLDPFGVFENKAGFKIKDDLLPVLGNEIAVAGSLKYLQPFFGAQLTSPKPSANADDKSLKGGDASPIFLIGIKDREAAHQLMPHVLDGFGLGEANLIAQTEKRGDTELVNYGGLFAYAFVGNFLIVSDGVTVRRVIDACLNQQTLASNNAFRSFRRWQPRQTLGEIYVSPALMAGYQDLVQKQSAGMDPALRDLLMQLDPAPVAITYALANEGFGALHELHLPKTLVIRMIAGMTTAMSAMRQGSPEMNEAIAMSLLRMIVTAEATYQATEGNGSYGSLDKLAETKLISKEMLDRYGYKIDLTVSGDQFEATATPVEYGKTGRRSFFVDQSGVVRGDDHGGGPATIADKPVQP